MTYATDTHATPKTTGLLRGISNRIASRFRYTRTLRQLNDLTDRDLADIGLSRSMLPDVARETMHIGRAV